MHVRVSFLSLTMEGQSPMKQRYCILHGIVPTKEQIQAIEALYGVEVACGPDACTIFFFHTNKRKASRTIAKISRLLLEPQP